MKKNLLYGIFALSFAVAGFTSCDPVDGDDHSLGGSVISQEALSLSISAGDENNNFTVTNNSQALKDVRFFVSTDGKKLTNLPVGESIVLQLKKKGSYPVYLYAFSACDQKMISQTIEVAENWVDPNAPAYDPTEWMGFTGENNMFKGSPADYRFWFADGGWAQIADPDNDGNVATGITFTMNGAGSGQWQAQMHVEHTGIKLSAGKNYDFSVVIISSADNVKATVKPQKGVDDSNKDDNTFFTDNVFPLHKGVNVIALSDQAGFDGDFKVAFDFAGAPEGTDFTVKNFFISEHDAANVVPLDYNDANNLWKNEIEAKDAFNVEFWWADASWSQIANPDFDYTKKENGAYLYTITAPAATAGQWQAQNTWVTATEFNGETIDFSCIVVPNVDLKGVTFKYTEADYSQSDKRDGNFFFAEQIDLKANVPNVVKFTGCTLPDGYAHAMNFIIDLGGNPEGAEVKVSDIVVIKK